jgi:tRNA A-37 threonylcarbamoyl transferase component Bud32
MTDRALEDVQDEVLDRLHAGEPVDRDAVLAAHPGHADALRRFFTLLDVIETPEDGELAAPSRLGEFEILRELGRGGMGVVYEARQASLNRRVALKVLPPALRRDRRLLTRFQREAEAAGRLRHPNIVPVYSIGESAGAPFFAMELVDGRSLADVIRVRREGGSAGLPTGPDAWRAWALEVAARIADALDYAHGRGILHRDIKPGNILLEADGTPRLTDFGLALDMQASELTLSGERFGSPLYMSPEQAFRHDQPVDARTDIYSLAVTLYEALTLRLPYRGTTHAELMSALSTGEVVPPREADPSMPEPLARVLSQALRSDPRERYATAAAFAGDLRASLGRPAEVRAVARPAAAVPGRAGAGGETAGGPLGGPGPRPEDIRGVDADVSGERWGRMMGLFLVLAGLGVMLGKGVAEPAPWVLVAVGAALWVYGTWARRSAARSGEPPCPSFRARHPTLGHPLVSCGCLLLATLAGLAVASSMLLVWGSSRPGSPAGPGTPGARSIGSVAPTAGQLRSLAAGTLEGGRDVLAAWLRPDFAVRGVVARRDPGQCRFTVAYAVPAAADAGTALVWECTLLVDGRPVPVPQEGAPISLGSSQGDGAESARGVPLDVLLGEALQADALTVQPVIAMSVGVLGEGDVARILDPGTTWTWTGPARTLFVYDEYPADYPALVTGPDLDPRMHRLLTPRHVRYDGASGAPGRRVLRLALVFEPSPRGPVPAAMDVALRAADVGEPVGWASFTSAGREEMPDGLPVNERATTTLEFALAEPPSAAEQGLLLGLQAGTLSALRLTMTPSRGAALAEPLLDRYWGGEVDEPVPVWPHVSGGEAAGDG